MDGLLFFKNHFEGGYLFRDMVTLEATPPTTPGEDWRIEYQFASQRDQEPRVAALIDGAPHVLTFELPIEQSSAPGIKARLHVETRLWNDWQA